MREDDLDPRDILEVKGVRSSHFSFSVIVTSLWSSFSFVGQSVGLLVDRLVCHNFLIGQKATLPCYYHSNCFHYLRVLSTL